MSKRDHQFDIDFDKGFKRGYERVYNIIEALEIFHSSTNEGFKEGFEVSCWEHQKFGYTATYPCTIREKGECNSPTCMCYRYDTICADREIANTKPLSDERWEYVIETVYETVPHDWMKSMIRTIGWYEAAKQNK